MDDGKILIMGVGGCGSSFIWRLLDDCGLDTKGINEWMRWSNVRKAHREGTAHLIEYPTVIKHLGGFITNLNMHIDQNNWKVRHIFFAVSTYDLQIKTYVRRRGERQKGLSEKERYALADKDYKRSLGMGMIQLIERDHPFTMVRCPRTILEPEYCYNQLKVVLDDMSYEEFYEIHKARLITKKIEGLKKWR